MISEGSSKLASVPSGGGGGGAAAASGGAAAAGGAAAEEKEPEKEEGTLLYQNALQMNVAKIITEKEESDEDMGFGLFD